MNDTVGGVSSSRSDFQSTGGVQDDNKAQKAAQKFLNEVGSPQKAVQALQTVLPENVGKDLNKIA